MGSSGPRRSSEATEKILAAARDRAAACDSVAEDELPLGHSKADLPLIDTWSTKILEYCRAAYEAGVKIAVYDALNHCIEQDYPPPLWVWVAACKLIKKELIRPTGRGRLGNLWTRSVSDFRHFERYELVEIICVREDVGLMEACKLASENLKGSHSHVAPDGIRKSHKLVTEALKDPAQAKRFHFVTLKTERDLAPPGYGIASKD